METVSPALAYELLALLLVIENGVWIVFSYPRFMICMPLLPREATSAYASVTIPTERIEMYVNFTASITNHLGAMLNLTENNLTGANVFVDTISPTIELIGDADYTVLVNTTFIDPNATASDGSPGYSASNYSKSETGILNTSILDSTVTYTYTADDDAAGNPGASTTRTVTVVAKQAMR